MKLKIDRNDCRTHSHERKIMTPSEAIDQVLERQQSLTLYFEEKDVKTFWSAVQREKKRRKKDTESLRKARDSGQAIPAELCIDPMEDVSTSYSLKEGKVEILFNPSLPSPTRIEWEKSYNE